MTGYRGPQSTGTVTPPVGGGGGSQSGPAQPVIIRPWPAQMPAELAAEYCGYTGPNRASAFRAAVKRGLYPKPIKRPGEKQKWRKRDLKAVIEGPAAAASGQPDPVFE